METDTPLFSVVIVSYRNGEQWKDAVDSVLTQDYPAIELIVSDDGSPDFLLEAAEEFIAARKCGSLVRSVILKSDKNLGTVANMRKADALCTGRYLLHFAADDALAGEHVLASFASALRKKEPEVLGVYGRSEICDSDLHPCGTCSFDPVQAMAMNTLSPQEQWQRLCQGCCIHMGATAFVREEYLQSGGIDPTFDILDDWPFFLENARRGKRFQFIDWPALRYRQGGVTQKRGANPGYRRLLSDHLLLVEQQILSYSSELSLLQRLQIWMRYLDDRADARKMFGELSHIAYRELRCLYSGAPVFLLLWWIKRHRRQIAAVGVILLCLWLITTFK